MTARRLEFGYHPGPLHLQAGPVTIVPLPDLAETVADMETGESAHNDWIYAPPQQVRVLGGGVQTLPYPADVQPPENAHHRARRRGQ
jgi:hypothetical protein